MNDCLHPQGSIQATKFFRKPIDMNLLTHLMNQYGESIKNNPAHVPINMEEKLFKKSLLIIDPNNEELYNFSQTLRISGFNSIYTATNGINGYNKWLQNYIEFGLIFIDCNIALDADNIINKIKEFCSKEKISLVPIIGLCQSNDIEHKMLCQKLGFNDILTRPLNSQSVLNFANAFLQ